MNGEGFDPTLKFARTGEVITEPKKFEFLSKSTLAKMSKTNACIVISNILPLF